MTLTGHPAVSARSISKRYGGVRALTDVDLDILARDRPRAPRRERRRQEHARQDPCRRGRPGWWASCEIAGEPVVAGITRRGAAQWHRSGPPGTEPLSPASCRVQRLRRERAAGPLRLVARGDACATSWHARSPTSAGRSRSTARWVDSRWPNSRWSRSSAPSTSAPTWYCSTSRTPRSPRPSRKRSSTRFVASERAASPSCWSRTASTRSSRSQTT